MSYFQICAYSFFEVSAATFGDPCTDASHCTITGQECASNNTCACFVDNNYYYDGNKCVKGNISLHLSNNSQF